MVHFLILIFGILIISFLSEKQVRNPILTHVFRWSLVYYFYQSLQEDIQICLRGASDYSPTEIESEPWIILFYASSVTKKQFEVSSL